MARLAMRSYDPNRAPRRPFYRVIAGDWKRAAITSATLAAILALGFFAGGKLFDTASKPQPPKTAQKSSNGWAHRVGSILFVPADGGMCEQRQFDNASGRMLSLGYVKCTDGLAQGGSGEPTWSHDNASRINAILSAFKK